VKRRVFHRNSSRNIMYIVPKERAFGIFKALKEYIMAEVE
jgi:hypothetical protein